jgi:hypothetical protein
MSPEVARNAIVFLMRVDLKGTESMAHFEAVKALEAFANPVPAPAVEEPPCAST